MKVVSSQRGPIHPARGIVLLFENRPVLQPYSRGLEWKLAVTKPLNCCQSIGAHLDGSRVHLRGFFPARQKAQLPHTVRRGLGTTLRSQSTPVLGAFQDGEASPRFDYVQETARSRYVTERISAGMSVQ